MFIIIQSYEKSVKAMGNIWHIACGSKYFGLMPQIKEREGFLWNRIFHPIVFSTQWQIQGIFPGLRRSCTSASLGAAAIAGNVIDDSGFFLFGHGVLLLKRKYIYFTVKEWFLSIQKAFYE